MDTYELWVNLLGVIQLPILCEGIPSRYLQMHPTSLTLELRRCNRETAGLKLGFGYKTSSIWTGYEQIWTNGPIFLLFLKNLHFHTLNLHLYIVYVIFSYYEHSLNIYIYVFCDSYPMSTEKRETNPTLLAFLPPRKKPGHSFHLVPSTHATPFSAQMHVGLSMLRSVPQLQPEVRMDRRLPVVATRRLVRGGNLTKKDTPHLEVGYENHVWVVVFWCFLFSPLGNWSNLTSIFFKWVGSTHQLGMDYGEKLSTWTRGNGCR